jgi:hypothetical protein
MNIRICKLCGKKLSRYNKAEICWIHPEHPDYGGQTPKFNKIDPLLEFISEQCGCGCHGSESKGRIIVDLEYYGRYQT